MYNVSCVNFRGHGSESTGSIAHRNNPAPKDCPTSGDTINFRGRADSFEKKGPSTGTVILTLAGLTAAGIIGLGYAHKVKAFDKLKDGWMKKTIGKLEPAGEKCHEWCATAKTKSTELWAKIKDKFSSNKG